MKRERKPPPLLLVSGFDCGSSFICSNRRSNPCAPRLQERGCGDAWLVPSPLRLAAFCKTIGAELAEYTDEEIPVADDVDLRRVGYVILSARYRRELLRPQPTAEEANELIRRLCGDLKKSLRDGTYPPPQKQGPPKPAESYAYAQRDLEETVMRMLQELRWISDERHAVPPSERTDQIERATAHLMFGKMLQTVWYLNSQTEFQVDLAPLQQLSSALQDVQSGENNRLLMTGEPAASLMNRRISERRRLPLRALAAAQVELLKKHKVEKTFVAAAKRVARVLEKGGYHWKKARPEETVRKWHTLARRLENNVLDASEERPVTLKESEDNYLDSFLRGLLTYDHDRRKVYGIDRFRTGRRYDPEAALAELEGLCRASCLPKPDLGN